MASVIGVNRTKADDPIPTNILDRGLFGSEVLSFVDEYEASSLASGSDIKVGPQLNVGDRFLFARVYHDALGGSSTLALGDAGSSTRYMAAGSSASAGVQESNAIDGVGYEITGTNDQDIKITTGGATITGTIKILGFYTRGA